jgi:hypothetical protein
MPTSYRDELELVPYRPRLYLSHDEYHPANTIDPVPTIFRILILAKLLLLLLSSLLLLQLLLLLKPSYYRATNHFAAR